jgi:3-oxoacyl-[acyl-carrier-protein] synthase III
MDTRGRYKRKADFKRRRLLLGYGAEAVKSLLKRTNNKPEDIELVIVATITPDMIFHQQLV